MFNLTIGKYANSTRATTRFFKILKLIVCCNIRLGKRKCFTHNLKTIVVFFINTLIGGNNVWLLSTYYDIFRFERPNNCRAISSNIPEQNLKRFQNINNNYANCRLFLIIRTIFIFAGKYTNWCLSKCLFWFIHI